MQLIKVIQLYLEIFMKNKFILSACVLAPFLCFAQQNTEQEPLNDTKSPRYHNRMAVFGPLHQVYERTKPQSFYTGIEAWMLFGKTKETPGHTKFLNAEMRFGYNVLIKNKNYLTPFVGVTYIQNFATHYHYEWSYSDNKLEELRKNITTSGMLFGGLGLYYDHAFSSIFDLGVKAKGMMGGKVSENKPALKAPITGLDVALPMTFRFGPHRHWDFRLEPFCIALWGSSNDYQTILGFRNTIGYRF